jgi:hypothetical protein
MGAATTQVPIISLEFVNMVLMTGIYGTIDLDNLS